MAFVNGDNEILYIKRDGSYLPIACLDSNSFSETADEIDTTTSDNAGWKTTLPTNQGYEISFSGITEADELPELKNSYFDLLDLKRNRTLIEWRIGLPTSNYDYGNAYLIDLSSEAPADDLISFSGTLRGYGRPKNLLKEIYDQWATAVTSETSGAVSSKRCVLNKIQELI